MFPDSSASSSGTYHPLHGECNARVAPRRPGARPPAHAERLEEAVGAAPAAAREGLTAEEVEQRRDPAAVRPEESQARAVLGELVESLVEPLQLLLVAVGVLRRSSASCATRSRSSRSSRWSSAVEAIPEVRAKRALKTLRDLSAPNAPRPPGGRRAAVPLAGLRDRRRPARRGRHLVAADARVVEADGLATDESRLTGEPVAAAKGPEPVDAGAPLAERSSLLHAGTAVVTGAGEGVVVALGADTEIGRLGRLVAQAREPPTPLQRAMAELARAALIVAVTACALVPLLGVLRASRRARCCWTGYASRSPTIPEELPILVTALVAIGGLRLAQHGVLLRRLRAAEAVGRDDRAARRQDRDADREPARDRAASTAIATAC